MSHSSNVSAYFLVNCGILLEYENHQILVDGFFKRPPEEKGSSGLYEMPEEMYSNIAGRKPPFSNVELFLFTHNHWDHCDLAGAQEYCQNHNAALLLPAEDDSNYLYENDWVKIESICCVHDIPSNTGNQKHCAFRVELGGKSFLFTGDMDIKDNPVPAKIYEKTVDYLFYNVHHLFYPNGRKLVQNFIKPGTLFIQHLPNPEDDPYGLNHRIENKLKIYGEELPSCIVLNQPMTKLPLD